MGTRKELKKRARLSVKQSYWRAVSVCFLIAMLTTAYPVTTTFFRFPCRVRRNTVRAVRYIRPVKF